MTRIAVTGASGFIGRHFIAHALQEGNDVRGLVRDQAGSGGTPNGAEMVQGDVRSLEAVRPLIQGCDVVVHLAPGFTPDNDAAESITSGTQNVVQAAADAGVQRLVLMSCLGADAAAHSPFFAAKWKAEQLVRGSGVPFTILRSSLVLGRGDGVVKPLGEVIRSWPVIPIAGRGIARQQPVDVDDLARCLLAALTSETTNNESVSVGGPAFVTFRQLVDLISGQIGVVRAKLLLPQATLPAVSAILPPPARPLYSQPRAAQFHQGVVASPGIVERMFGFTPHSIVPNLADYLA